MNILEKLYQEAYDENIIVKEVSLNSNSDGLYKDCKIALNKNKLDNDNEKICVLAEELGHHYTSYGNIIDLKDISNLKQEYKAREIAYNKLVSLNKLVEAFHARCENRYEFAEYLNITETFLDEALEYYKNKHGHYAKVGRDTIFFTPRFYICTEI
ncbi:ImmA/IrrE family metallo-endopeptidase [Faecalimicrobium sp. JNUCC 81]